MQSASAPFIEAVVSIKRSLARLAHSCPRMLDVASVRGGLPGEVHQTAHGELHLIDEYLEPAHHHGKARIADVLEVSAARLAQLAMDPALENVDPRQAVFLDTETTGLAGGAGTVPFLIGMGWFEDESMRIQQLFLPQLGAERPMLNWLAQRLESCSCLVSFNGKTFDWPLLRNRFVLNRVRAPALPVHVDLLHCARRIFRSRLRSIRLVELEKKVLGMHREDDVSGALIPQLYFDYLDGGDVSPLAKVVEHNANDLIALAALMAKLVAHFEEVHGADDPRDHLAYARVAERVGDQVRARAFATAAANGGGGSACTVQALLLGARIARRVGDLDAEERALAKALAAAQDEDSRSAVALALAKLFEHRRKDLHKALEHAAFTEGAEGEEASQRRRARLTRRLSRMG